MPDISVRFTNVVVEAYSIAICVILLLYHRRHLKDNNSQKYWFVAMLICNVAMMLGDMTDWLFNGRPEPWALAGARLGMCVFFSSSGLILMCFTGYLIAFMGLEENQTGRILWKMVLALTCLQVLFSILSVINGMYFYHSDRNEYIRGPLFWLSQAIPVMIYVADGLIIFRGRHQVKQRELASILGYIFLPLAGQILQAVFYGLAAINVMTTIALLLVNINVQSEQELAAKRAEKELAELRIDVMLSQIRPHFLYNSLTAIRQLCDTDTAQAKESILDFSRFLRANMNSLTTKEPIPFERELEHVRSYLNLEQQRFGKRLKVIYDINSREFKLPTLTLQPMVENAVRYGIKKRPEGGTVKIYTEEQENDNVIQVIDDGDGFQVSEGGGDNRSHIGIANVKRRLEEQCGGNLTIESGCQGTRVTIRIPKVWGGKTYGFFSRG